MKREQVTHQPVVLVFGAINQDEVARVDRHPLPGETVVTDTINVYQGGKGANQAFAAAIAGAGVTVVRMVGAIGDDAAGDAALDSLHSVGVDTTLVKQVSGRPTGRAYITVTEDGQNSIVVGLGANAFVSPTNLVAAQRADVAIAQTELGAAATEALAAFARSCGARLIINDGPVVSLSADTLELADPLIVNQHEAADLLGDPVDHVGPERLATLLMGQLGSRSLVVTLGGDGCVIADGHGVRRVAAVKAERVVDTTGAGDTFVGALAASLALDPDLDLAVTRAAEAAAHSVAWPGARPPLSAFAGGPIARNPAKAVR